MRNLIIGIIIGFFVGGSVSFAALRGNIQEREYDKFIAASDGSTAIRAVIVTP